MINKFSLILLTHNSADKLRLSADFLELFDELIAIDDMSTDKTDVILKKNHFVVIKKPFDGDFGERHNEAMIMAKNDWVFFLDDDETPDSFLTQSIKALKNQDLSKVGGFYIKRVDKVLGEYLRYGEQGNMRLMRLVNKKKGEWVRKVHEYFETNSKVLDLDGLLLHDQSFSVERFLGKADFYGPLDAESLIEENKKFNWIEMFKPPAKFFWNYVLLLGFLDGYRGLFLAYLIAVQSIIVRIYQRDLS